MLLPRVEEDGDDDLMEFDGFNFNTEEAKGFVIEVQLPLMTTGKFFNLQSSGKIIYLKCGRFYELTLNIPLKFEKDQLKAFFDIEKRSLRLEGAFVEKEQEESDEEEEGEAKENIIQINEKKIKEKNIQIKSDLLTDLV